MAITAAFQELSNWIGQVGRLKLYDEAYPVPRMAELVEEVYLTIGEFAVECQKYYLRPSYGTFN
jgi:hypothetical protein